MYISRIDGNGKSLSHKVYKAVETGSIKIKKIVEADGVTRLDQYAAVEFGNENGINWWIIAAASGIGWMFDMKVSETIGGPKEGVTLIIPDFESARDYIDKLKIGI